jgi:hypothetical protein
LIALETTAATFDTVLYLLDADCQVIASDDDSGAGTLSRLSVTVPSTGVYTVVATSHDPATTGSYTLELNPTGATCSVGTCCYNDTLELTLPSDTYSGSLGTGDDSGGPRGSGHYFDDLEFLAPAGTDVIIETTAAAFDSYLYLLDEECNVIASNDDGGVGLLSRIVRTLTDGGVYTVIVTTYSAGTTGSYTVVIDGG